MCPGDLTRLVKVLDALTRQQAAERGFPSNATVSCPLNEQSGGLTVYSLQMRYERDLVMPLTYLIVPLQPTEVRALRT